MGIALAAELVDEAVDAGADGGRHSERSGGASQAYGLATKQRTSNDQ